jgi:ribokinase
VEWVEFVDVDRLPASGQVAHAKDSFYRAAGGGGVVAAVLAGLGADVDFFCALGEDDPGRAAAQQLSARGMRLHVAWRKQPTRRAVTMLEAGGERTIVTIGERLQPTGSDDLEWDRLSATDGVYFTAGDALALALARATRTLVASPRAHDAFADPVTVDALVFSANDRDECAWAEKIASNARVLVATDGERGGRWWGVSEGSWSAAQAPLSIGDSYGCGDSFAAGFTLAFAAGESIAQAATLGAWCGARCLERHGAP